ncbi:hypothetical protein FB446DRAFT_794174 [Lentinula raphanica]|nr:hypothetical protein FB446DRAFT_794174 [Lentinula raphanica]
MVHQIICFAFASLMTPCPWLCRLSFFLANFVISGLRRSVNPISSSFISIGLLISLHHCLRRAFTQLRQRAAQQKLDAACNYAQCTGIHYIDTVKGHRVCQADGEDELPPLLPNGEVQGSFAVGRGAGGAQQHHRSNQPPYSHPRQHIHQDAPPPPPTESLRREWAHQNNVFQADAEWCAHQAHNKAGVIPPTLVFPSKENGVSGRKSGLEWTQQAQARLRAAWEEKVRRVTALAAELKAAEEEKVCVQAPAAAAAGKPVTPASIPFIPPQTDDPELYHWEIYDRRWAAIKRERVKVVSFPLRFDQAVTSDMNIGPASCSDSLLVPPTFPDHGP